MMVNIDGTGTGLYHACVLLILTTLTVSIYGWFSWRANNISGRDIKEIDAIFCAIFLAKRNNYVLNSHEPDFMAGIVCVKMLITSRDNEVKTS